MKTAAATFAAGTDYGPAWSTGGALALLVGVIVYLVKRDDAKGTTRLDGLASELADERNAHEATRQAGAKVEAALRDLVLDLTEKLARCKALAVAARQRSLGKERKPK